MHIYSAPPTSQVKQAPNYAPPSMPPSSHALAQTDTSANLLNADLIERTREVVLYIALSLAELGCDATEWRAIVRDFWGIDNLESRKLASPANLQATHQAIVELVQILLVEGALLFGRAEFENMERVRKIVELTLVLQHACEQAQQ